MCEQDLRVNGQSQRPPTAATNAVLNAGDAADPNIRAQAGASSYAQRISDGPKAIVNQLSYTWDMSAMFFTYKVIGMMHNDRTDYVKTMRHDYKEVFANEQSMLETMKSLPHIIMRFPGIPPDPSSSENYPLSDRMPLEKSRYQAADRHKV